MRFVNGLMVAKDAPPRFCMIEAGRPALIEYIVGGKAVYRHFWNDVVLIHHKPAVRDINVLNRVVFADNGFQPRDIIPGTFLICGGNEQELKNLSLSQIIHYSGKFLAPDRFSTDTFGNLHIEHTEVNDSDKFMEGDT